jgi:hypothetical protein
MVLNCLDLSIYTCVTAFVGEIVLVATSVRVLATGGAFVSIVSRGLHYAQDAPIEHLERL